MNPSRFRSRGFAVLAILALLFSPSAGHAAAPAAEAPARSEAPVRKSVYGKLQLIDANKKAVVLLADNGKRLAWRVEAAVIAGIREFKAGAPMVVIYRQTAANEKIVTALAFPGAADTPTYVNTTGERVSFRSGPAVEGACDHAETAREVPIVAGDQTETGDACWCCAPFGEACQPSSKTGLGKAFLARCF